MNRTEEDFLAHYGVKGMKWGIRKDGKPGSKRGTLTRKERAARAEREDAKVRRRQLSDKDLNKYIERLSNEKKLKTLVEEDLTPGRAFAKRVASQSGEKIARVAVTGAGLFLVKKGIEAKFGKEASTWIPKPKK